MLHTPRYRITTHPGDEYRSDNLLVVDCDEQTARRLLPVWAADAPNLTECREILPDGTTSSICIVAFGPNDPDRFDCVGRGRP